MPLCGSDPALPVGHTVTYDYGAAAVRQPDPRRGDVSAVDQAALADPRSLVAVSEAARMLAEARTRGAVRPLPRLGHLPDCRRRPRAPLLWNGAGPEVRPARHRALAAPDRPDGGARMRSPVGERRSTRHPCAVDPALVQPASARCGPALANRLAKLPAGERSWRGEREASDDERRRPEPLDRFEAAIVFAMQEASRLQREREAHSEGEGKEELP